MFGILNTYDKTKSPFDKETRLAMPRAKTANNDRSFSVLFKGTLIRYYHTPTNIVFFIHSTITGD